MRRYTLLKLNVGNRLLYINDLNFSLKKIVWKNKFTLDLSFHTRLLKAIILIVCTSVIFLIVCTSDIFLIVCTSVIFLIVCTLDIFLIVCTLDIFLIVCTFGSISFSMTSIWSHSIHQPVLQIFIIHACVQRTTPILTEYQANRATNPSSILSVRPSISHSPS